MIHPKTLSLLLQDFQLEFTFWNLKMKQKNLGKKLLSNNNQKNSNFTKSLNFGAFLIYGTTQKNK